MAPALSDARRIAAVYGITVESLWLYEARGLLQPVLVNGAKLYTSRDRTRLEIVLKGKRLGFSLEEIEKLLRLPLPRLATSCATAQPRPVDLAGTIATLRAILAERGDCDLTIDELTALLANK